MPNVAQFEVLHGIVLTKLVRNPQPVALRMIETRPREAWSIYRINDVVSLCIKHSAKPYLNKRSKKSWQFLFSPRDLEQLHKDAKMYTALVCGAGEVTANHMQICLLNPDDMAQLLDTSASRAQKAQAIRVTYLPGKQLRVSSARVSKDRLIDRSRLDKWEIPGS